MGFNGYFLIIWDFINWGKNQGIVFGPGRGSAAGSIIAYSLKITDLDPQSGANGTFGSFNGFGTGINTNDRVNFIPPMVGDNNTNGVNMIYFGTNFFIKLLRMGQPGCKCQIRI